ncbi:iron-sulfur cluster assembly accessory protein [Candidatus Micrarchaeota archaeon]|nr:iron-sulfur cluster assembly accessory protein [Candidatus Micrarchaeota archaeon]
MITKDMTIGDVVARSPEAVEVMMKYGFQCVGCHVSPYETIEGGAKGHGLNDEQVDKIIKEINELMVKKAEEVKDQKAEVKLTSLAVSQIKKLMEKEGKKDQGLRISVIPGGCAGYSYEMEFDEKASESDVVVEYEGLKVFYSREYSNTLDGIVIDYRESLNGSGFVMKNPHAKRSCSCGSSFST